MRRKLAELGAFFDVQSWGALVLLSVVVGLIAGFGAICFHLLLQWLQHVAIDRALTAAQSWHGRVLIVVIPTLGGLVSGCLVFFFAPETEGHGTDSMIRAFHRLRGKIRTRVPFVKTAASAVTLGCGGAAGQEGPIAQIGAGLGSLMSGVLKLSDRHRRIFMLAGASGGIGAIFRAPLGGALFSAEVLYREPDFEYEAIVPSIIASITAYATFTNFFGYEFLFSGVRGLDFRNLRELGLYLILGAICALLGFVYVKVFYGSRDHFFRRLPLPAYLRPALGGLMLGLFGLWLPEVLADGYNWVQALIDDRLGAAGPGLQASATAFHACRFLLLLAFAKMIAVSLTISSGGSGGVFGPSLFIGAMIGGSFAYFIEGILPEMMSQETRASFVLVGMGAFFAGVAKVPIASLIMVTEMTGSYGLIVPLMLTCTVSYMLSRRWTLYEQQVTSQVDSPAHMGDFIVNLLEEIQVRDVLPYQRQQMQMITGRTKLREIRELMQESFQSMFPVVEDGSNRLLGVIDFRDIREVINDDMLGNVVLAETICDRNVPTASLDENLHSVLRRMTREKCDAMPVIDTLDDHRIIDVITRNDVTAAYDRQLQRVNEMAGMQEREPTPSSYRGDSEIIEIKVLSHHYRLLREVKDIHFPEETLLACIRRGAETIIPRGNTQIQADDCLLVLTKSDRESQVRRSLTSTQDDGED